MSNLYILFFIFDILFLGDKMENDKVRELIYENQNLIYSIIHKFRSRDVEDLFQVGCVGLIKAYQKYDSRMDVKFTSYAYNYIVGEIYQYIIKNRNIRMSPANMKLINSIKKAEEFLTNHLGRCPNVDELCSFVEIEPYRYYELENALIIDNLDNFYNIAIDNTLSKDQLIDLKNAINNLTIEEKNLIKARYFNNYTQAELAKIYNTNQVKISRDEKKILSKLKAKMY